MSISNKYAVNIGLEVHIQLLTKTKLFCSDPNVSYADPNTSISPITLAHPGTLPHLNQKALELAIRFGLASHSEISNEVEFARKHYCYPDLPKGYQITQHDNPICKQGYVRIITKDGKEKTIFLHHTHLEEDAGKSIHDIKPDVTLLDYNRAGTPLIEIVTMPELTSSEEACLFVEKVQKMVRYLKVSNADMEKGHLRCDANISLRPTEQKILGTKVEIKNVNSFKFLRMGIELEIDRMAKLLDEGMKVKQETRGLDLDKKKTFALRSKEDAHDYRYMPDPDLLSFPVSVPFLNNIKGSMPTSLEELYEQLTLKDKLSDTNANILMDDMEAYDYYKAIKKQHPFPTEVFNWIFGPIKSYLNKFNTTFPKYSLPVNTTVSLLKCIQEGLISYSVASNQVINYLYDHPEESDVKHVIQTLDLAQDADRETIHKVVEKVIADNPEKVKQYAKKKGLLSFFIGQTMKELKGKGKPKEIQEAILKKLLS